MFKGGTAWCCSDAEAGTGRIVQQAWTKSHENHLSVSGVGVTRYAEVAPTVLSSVVEEHKGHLLRVTLKRGTLRGVRV